MIHLFHCTSDPAYYIFNWRDFIYNDFGWCRSWQKKRRKRDVCGKVGQYYALEQKNRKPRVAAKLTQCTILSNFVSHKYFQIYKEDTKLPYMMDFFSIWYPVIRQTFFATDYPTDIKKKLFLTFGTKNRLLSHAKQDLHQFFSKLIISYEIRT